MDSMNAIIELIDKQLIDSEVQINALAQNIDRLKQVRELLQAGQITNLIS